MAGFDPLLGSSFSGFRILQKLYSVETGPVYKAQDERLGRSVALKLLPEAIAKYPDELRRLRRELATASTLNHPNICAVHEMGEYEGRSFIIMEGLEGHTLRELIGKGPLESGNTIMLGEQIVSALDAAHGQGIIHRDLNSKNIFVTNTGQAKVLDWGLSRSGVKERYWGGATTVRGMQREWPSYVAPEQIQGEKPDPRSDLFSFGVLLYEMATAKLPFQGKSSAGLFHSILRTIPAAPTGLNPELPSELEKVIRNLLQKDKKKRYQHASDVRAEIEKLVRERKWGVMCENCGSLFVGLSLSPGSAIDLGHTECPACAIAWCACKAHGRYECPPPCPFCA
jgi:serine/threonine protein kinase